uniref:Protein NATD1 n=1 Tax=Panagrolaimus superbus TaxID=310955 RepID=A0A914Y1J8_9BILA
MAHKVQHCTKSAMFFIQMNNKKSVLEYKKLPNNVFDFWHTEVPPEHRGHGVAAELVKHGFQYCKDNQYKVLPSCSYVAKYAREMATPEEKKLVVDSA